MELKEAQVQEKRKVKLAKTLLTQRQPKPMPSEYSTLREDNQCQNLIQ